MSSYIQMGHDSQNLLGEKDLNNFGGAILSPVNETVDKIISQIQNFKKNNFKMIFDPQLYYPNSKRGELSNWEYFPKDFDTADYSSKDWWNNINHSLLTLSVKISPSIVCSPAFVPKIYSDEYYELNNWIAENLKEKIESHNLGTMLTSIVRLSDLTKIERSAEIASIISSSSIDEVFLVLLSDIEPRRELNNTEELKGALKLIYLLSNSDIKVTVGFSSTDLILWKAAGADNCASGKFFNLRRFTPSRWDSPKKGGGQLPYWIEESLLAYLREADIQKIKNYKGINISSSKNPFEAKILELFEEKKGKPWLALSWRQYLHWFVNFEKRFSENKIDASLALRNAEKIWKDLDENDILFDEPRNDGTWLRSWRKAIIDFNKDKS
jgi:hypothetical protein